MCGSMPGSILNDCLQRSELPWFAIAVRTRWERAVECSLTNRGHECLAPVHKERHRWSDRWKEIELPLFPGYVFSRLDVYNRLPVLNSPGVLYIVGGKVPTPIDSEEIEAIQRVAKSGLGAQPSAYIQVGQTVSIAEGPLTGLTGIVLRHKAQTKLVLSVTLLKRSIAVEIDSSWISTLTSAA